MLDESDYFLLAFVEFDDMGWLYRREQMARLFEVLEQEASQRAVVMFVFAHGWTHNADACDTNVACVRSILRQIAGTEKRFDPPRRVVGVYVGWRGLSLDGPPLWKSLSFYDRKAAALQVAQGSTRELFARLKHFQRRQNERIAGDPKTIPRSQLTQSRLVLVGHSFGGLMVYHAVAQWLIDSAASGENEPVVSYGDLVILINPAFEASRYEPLHEIATLRKRYPPRQAPVFMMFTSENDQATKTAFPLGRLFNSWFGSFTNDAQRDADRNTPGHLQRYQTHALALVDPPGSSVATAATRTPQPCQCPYGVHSSVRTRGEIGEEAADFAKFDRQWRDEEGRLKPGWSRRYSSGAELRRVRSDDSADNPFWIVSVDRRIIDGHSDFYTEVFMDFVRQLYDDLVRTRR